MLKISLLGVPQVSLGHTFIFQNISNKGRALFYYLACECTVFTRAEAAAVLWPDLSDRAARHNLRTALSELRKEAANHLTITNSTVAFYATANYWLDTEAFEQGLRAQRSHSETATLQATCDLYQGEFLQGVSVRNASAFEEWLLLKRAEYHLLAVEAFTRLTQIYLARQDLDAAAEATRRLLMLDPWLELGHRTHMLILAQRGARGAALTHYAHMSTMLANEYGMEPTKETIELYHRIRTGEIGAPPTAVQSSQEQAVPAAQPQFIHDERRSDVVYGAQLSMAQPMVGRTDELAEIKQRLCFSSCRLMTLSGLKGVGKSRLALAAGRQLSQWDVYSSSTRHVDSQNQASLPDESWLPHDGVYFVSLPVDPEGGSPTVQRIAFEVALAHVMQIVHQPGMPLRQQLLNHLAGRQVLLILDQVVPTPIQRDLIASLLEAAPQMRILAAARHPLRLPTEFNLVLTGLSTSTSSPARAQDAVQFFLQQRKDRRSDWVADAEDLDNIERICVAVDGLPLGIELAASLADTIPLEVLATLLADTANEQTQTASDAIMVGWRRLHNVLAHQWDLLDEYEQTALMRLSVFPSPVSWRAMQEVSMTSPEMLNRLLETSLLYQDRHRQQLFMHESVRLYAERQRQARADLDAATVRRFCSYYAIGVANAAFGEMTLTHERVHLITNEWPCLLLAWRWTARNPQYATASRMMHGMQQLLAWYGYEKEVEVMRTRRPLGNMMLS